MISLTSVIINTMNEDPDLLTQAIKSYLNQKDVKMQLIISSIQGDVSEGIAKDFGLTFFRKSNTWNIRTAELFPTIYYWRLVCIRFG